MCDTFVALSNSTADGSVLFGKNSDRDANEAHEIVLFPREFHPGNERLQCTYIDIPQVSETNAVLLAKPFWIWGAEMGANDKGLVIGNEAIFSKLPAGKDNGLIGMDYLRLALERANSAYEAVKIITQLLETYGQSGNCGFAHPMYYHNSFLMADPHEAWVLETVAKHWVAQKVKDVRSISNGMTIGSEYDLASPDLVGFATRKGWSKKAENFNFSSSYSDLIMTFGADAKNRQCRTALQLSLNKSNIDLQFVFNLLRDHGAEAAEGWSPDQGLFGADVCMHLSAGPVRISQSTGSMVTHMKDGCITHWLTGTSAPCTGVFKPFWMDAGIPEMGNPPTGTYDPETAWWSHEDLHRAVLQDYAHRIRLYQSDRDAMEKEFMQQASDLASIPPVERFDFSRQCIQTAKQATTEWTRRVKGAEISGHRSMLHKMTWDKLDRQALRK